MKTGTRKVIRAITLILFPASCIAEQFELPALSNMPPAQAVSVLESQTTNGVTSYAEFRAHSGVLGKQARCNPIRTNDSVRLVFSIRAETKGGGIVAYFTHRPGDDRTNAVLWQIRSWTNEPDGDVQIEIRVFLAWLVRGHGSSVTP